MGAPSIPKALLVSMLAVSMAGAQPKEPPKTPPPDPSEEARNQVCGPDGSGLLVQTGGEDEDRDAAASGLATEVKGEEEPSGEPGDKSEKAPRFVRLQGPRGKKSTPASRKHCEAQFAAFTRSCQDCPAVVSPSDAVSFDGVKEMFSSANKGLGGLVMGLGALSRRDDFAGLQTKMTGLFDGSGAFSQEALGALLKAAPPDGSGGVLTDGPSVTGPAAEPAKITGASKYAKGADGNPQPPLLAAATPPAPVSAPRSWGQAVSDTYRSAKGAVSRAYDGTVDVLDGGRRDALKYWNEGSYSPGPYIERFSGPKGQLTQLKKAEAPASPGLSVRPAPKGRGCQDNCSWGTAKMNTLLAVAGTGLQAAGMSIIVADISKGPQGGHFAPHVSHAKGVDTDIIHKNQGDIKTNALVAGLIAKSAIKTGSGLTYLLSDSGQIPALRAQLAAYGAQGVLTPEEVRLASVSLRHWSGHADHFHVRIPD